MVCYHRANCECDGTLPSPIAFSECDGVPHWLPRCHAVLLPLLEHLIAAHLLHIKSLRLCPTPSAVDTTTTSSTDLLLAISPAADFKFRIARVTSHHLTPGRTMSSAAKLVPPSLPPELLRSLLWLEKTEGRDKLLRLVVYSTKFVVDSLRLYAANPPVDVIKRMRSGAAMVATSRKLFRMFRSLESVNTH